MREYLPFLILGGIIGCFTLIFLVAYAMEKNKQASMGFERNMADGEIVRRLLAYAKPYRGKFLLVLTIMLVSIVYDLVSPLLVGAIIELVQVEFCAGTALGYGCGVCRHSGGEHGQHLLAGHDFAEHRPEDSLSDSPGCVHPH